MRKHTFLSTAFLVTFCKNTIEIFSPSIVPDWICTLSIFMNQYLAIFWNAASNGGLIAFQDEQQT